MPRRNPFILLSLCLLLPAIALAKPKAKAPSTPSAPAIPANDPNAYNVIIAAGGSVEDAQAALKKFSAANLSFLQMTGGYPQIILSDSVEGLRPGFNIVVLGFCKDGKAASQIAKAMQQLAPGTYVRRVRGDYDGLCPTLQGEQWIVSSATETCKDEDKSKVTTTTVEVKQNGESVAEENFEGRCDELHSFTAKKLSLGDRTMVLVTDRHKAWRTSSADDAHSEQVDENTYELWSLEHGYLKRVLSAPMADDEPYIVESGNDWKHVSFSQRNWSGTRSFEFTWNAAKAEYEDTTPPEQADENAELDQEGD